MRDNVVRIYQEAFPDDLEKSRLIISLEIRQHLNDARQGAGDAIIEIAVYILRDRVVREITGYTERDRAIIDMKVYTQRDRAIIEIAV